MSDVSSPFVCHGDQRKIDSGRSTSGLEKCLYSAPSPTSRALVALQLLQAHPGITAAKLAEHLETSERAARRYVEMLREAGIAVRSQRGRYGGYTLDRGSRLPPLVFTPPEALALVMAILDGHHNTSEPDQPVGAALGKLLRALPTSVAAQADAVRRVTTVARDRAAVRPDPERVATLVDASEQHRSVRVDYRSEASNTWSVNCEPWAVVVRHGRWYLLCRTHPAGAVRTYRIDRINDIELLDTTFDPPDHLDPVAMLETHLAAGWEHPTEVIIDAPLAQVEPWISPVLGALEAIDSETTRLSGTTSNPTWYAEQLTALPAPFRIIADEALHNAITALAHRLYAATATNLGERQEMTARPNHSDVARR